MVNNCIKCGASNEDNANFCSKCGNNLTSSATVGPQIKSAPVGTAVGSTISMHPHSASAISAAPGMCSFHKSLPATYVCGRCGKAICSNCTFNYMNLKLCPQCYGQIIPSAQMPFAHPAYPY
jgi:hypothetical protein